MRFVSSDVPALRRARSAVLALVAGLAASLTLVAAAAPALADASPAPVGGDVAGGYLLGGSDGGVYNFGSDDFGSMGGKPLAQPIVGLAATPSGEGYWMVAADGGIFSFGDAGYHGSTGNIVLNRAVVGMAATPGAGYWFVAGDGGIFSFGDAEFYGSTGDITLNKPIVGMAATPTGDGYWFVAEDGGIFSFGDAEFYGSTGDITLNKPIVGMAATPTGDGYWMVASDGGIFSFGDARFHGSTGNIVLNKPIVDMAATPTGDGYWLVAEDGGIFPFGNAAFKGSAGGTRLNGRIIDMLPQGGDITAPKLHALTITPRSVDTSSAPATFDIRARISDDLSGVRAGSVWFTSPSGGQQFSQPFNATPLSGTAADGIFQGADFKLPAYSEQGTWRVTRVSLTDRAGNQTSIETPVLAAAGYPTTFQQTGAGDTTPPALAGLSITPGSVDTSTGPASFDIRARMTDNLSGVRAGSIWFTSASGGQQFSQPFNSTPLSGTATDGTFQGSDFKLHENSEQGTWRVTRFSMTDQAGNQTSIDGAALAAAGYPTTFQQTGAGDTTPPALAGLSITPGSVDTSTGPASLEIRAHITDNFSGLRAASIWFTSPSGGQQFSQPFTSAPLSGTAADGTFQGSDYKLPAYSEQGTWRATYFSMTDNAGNQSTINTAALAAAGYPTTFEVQRTG